MRLEYKHIILANMHLEKTLNELAREGWCLVSRISVEPIVVTEPNGRSHCEHASSIICERELDEHRVAEEDLLILQAEAPPDEIVDDEGAMPAILQVFPKQNPEGKPWKKKPKKR